MRGLAGMLIAVVSCAPITRSESTPPPANSCPDHPCSAYLEGSDAASCVGGVCVANAPVPGDLIVTVALPEDAFSGAGRTVLARLADLLASPSPSTECTDGPRCVRLPASVSFADAYIVTPFVATTQLHSSQLGAIKLNTSLPVHASFGPLWPPGVTSLASTAVAAGLPAFPVTAETSVVGGFGAVGPGGGTALGFQTYLLSGGAYARIIAPAPPFDQEFPPEVHVVSQFVDMTGISVVLDLTGTSLPTFALSRSDGPMDGWGAYLRDAASKTTLSPVKTLSGMSTPDGGIVLPTAHAETNADALQSTELVIAPPVDAGYPSEVFSLPLPQESYAVLPARIGQLVGTITWSDAALDADVVFEASAIYAAPPPTGGPGDDAGVMSPPTSGFQPQPNFEYTAHAHAMPSSAQASTYTMRNLPRGIYRIVVRPDDQEVADSAGLGPIHSVAIRDCFDTTDGTGDGGAEQDAGAVQRVPPIGISPAQTIQGSATVEDGRTLFAATVAAIPMGCPPPAAVVMCTPPADTPSCMPRASQASTGGDGGFSIALDPGSYMLQVQPSVGTQLPWTSRDIVAPASTAPSTPLAVTVAAPTHLHLQLADAQGPLVAGAVVRVYSVPAEGPALEVGLAITDASGRFDMYLDPALQ